MVVRKETQQTGATVNHSAPRSVSRGVRAVSMILAMALTMALMLLYAPAPHAEADEMPTNDGTPVNMVSIDSSTAVLTDTSGYHLQATVTNTTDQTVPAGTLSVAVNAFYTFVSRNDIQEWAEGTGHIPTSNTIGQADVPELQPGTSTKVSIDADANQQSLTAINSSGPKPVELDYTANGEELSTTHTFVTRTTDGLNTPSTPAMNITVVQPLAASGWTTDVDLMNKLVDEGGLNSRKLSKLAVPSENDNTRLKSLEQVFGKHDKLQVIADPTYLQAMAMPTQADGITQPALFDMTAYTAYNDSRAYANANIDTADWKSGKALATYRSALGDPSAKTKTYAWQGDGNWTMKALTEAKRQGYDAVIATHDFEGSDQSTVETGKTTVNTEAGEVTVLTAQSTLSNLAQGKATSDDADGEGSDAGRLARFIAQSAFYQMEQPYAERNLLVCLGTDSNPSDVDALMSAIEQSSWLNLTDLNTLGKASASHSGDEAAAALPQDSGLSDARRSSLQQTLSALTESAKGIDRFNSFILAEPTEKSSSGSTTWRKQLVSAHNLLALHALGNEASSGSTMLEGASQLSSLLFNGIAITPTENVNVVSETAKMPVTISNNHPYPVTVKVSSLTDSMQIVTSRFDTVEVPAHGEAQVAFTIRVSTSGDANATIALFDRQGTTFGATQTTHITSALQISDKSGFVIIGFAVLLGIVGLWRQFNRKKDPDE